MNTQDTVHRKSAAELRIRRVMDALEKNNMQAYYAPTCADAVKIAKELLQPGDVISCGGSVTLNETGVMLYNVDGNGNRVAAMLFGPKKVLVFAGCNKIVRDIDDAAKRVKSCATPANAMRLNLDTPCTHGACPGTDGELCAGCRSENRICAMYTVLARQRVKGRIHVILIGEEVGY